jgi:hypothetical protein
MTVLKKMSILKFKLYPSTLINAMCNL